MQSPQRSMQGEETKAGKNKSTADKNKSARKKKLKYKRKSTDESAFKSSLLQEEKSAEAIRIR